MKVSRVLKIIFGAIFILGVLYWFFFEFSFRRGSCIQMLQEANNPITGEVEMFSTPCDVPLGWQKSKRW